MTPHLEGFGWLGSLLGLKLAASGIDFTWNDPDTPHVAWRASTGSVYPAGDDRSLTNLASWQEWHNDGLLPAGTVAASALCFTNKTAPHGGRYPVTDLGWIRVAAAPCFAVDVPAVVAAARRLFADRRTELPAGRPRVIAHGFSGRCARYLWGWSAPVRLEVPPELMEATGGRPPLFYAREHRFHLVYAYPMASAPGWWRAGSAMVAQRRPQHGDAAGHLHRWRSAAATLYPKLDVTEVGDPVQGWRPLSAPTDPGGVRVHGDTVVLPPMGHSGVRWAPETIDAAAAACRRLNAEPGQRAAAVPDR